ncbi:hypothetical protein BAUCODRAFT_111482 [Baudoinia panamericana UAMH 10762]|uniref:Large ribosomal subunit protein eL14 domain-containing protein n=1 Tax=Baudoinia panamericana (strain UAMH 10762) TaxID=717646 RepID=M2LJZ5_BAUPA|nr:uncharacterized protein BAUCODRAFT_111482 [Baudoinia panamericana UAMH 10762]EMC94537.1 hypothetical protein BAUCODRAFT_111482 [Baudoinia panamericana UAMH 10762]
MGEATVTQAKWRLVEVGRVAVFARGPYIGRLAAIVQIIDHKRALVEGPSSDKSKIVPRHAAPLSQLSLTAIVIPDTPLAVGHAALKKRWDSSDVEGKFFNSTYAKNQAKFARRRELNDFERFKAMVLRRQTRFEERKALAQAKAAKA